MNVNSKNDEAENRQFILSEILELDIRNIDMKIFSHRDWKFYAKDRAISYQNYLPRKVKEIDLTDFRRLYTGASRSRAPLIYVKIDIEDLRGAFPYESVKKAWKLTSKVKLLKAYLVPKPNDFNSQYLCLEFENNHIITIKAVKQLFVTDDIYQKEIEEKEKYAHAFERFKQLVPFIIDRVIDLLSTDEIVPYEVWEENPLKYDLHDVDTANITLAKSMIEDLPVSELNLLVRTLRSRISQYDDDLKIDLADLERHKAMLNYTKQLIEQKKTDVKTQNH